MLYGEIRRELLRIVFKMSYKKQKKKNNAEEKHLHVEENDLIFRAHKTAYLLLVQPNFGILSAEHGVVYLKTNCFIKRKCVFRRIIIQRKILCMVRYEIKTSQIY